MRRTTILNVNAITMKSVGQLETMVRAVHSQPLPAVAAAHDECGNASVMRDMWVHTVRYTSILLLLT